jgi:hypothetical protein
VGADENLEHYLDACRGAVLDYARRVVGAEGVDVHIGAARASLQQLTVTVTHKLEVSATVAEVPGRQAPGPDDLEISQESRYRAEVQAQSQAERNRAETIDALLAAVRAEGYGARGERACLRTHPRRLLRSCTCKACRGHGEVTCDECRGTRTVRCGDCRGDGRVQCGACNGSGNVSETVSVTEDDGSSRSETRQVRCDCSSGQVTCSACSGSGNRTCGTCDGKSVIGCAACAGHGSVTSITTIRTDAVPSFRVARPAGSPAYVVPALEKAGLAQLARHGRVTLRDATADRVNAAVVAVYDCALPFCELTVEVLGRPTRWILFGETPQVAEAGGAERILLQADFDALAALPGSAVRWSPLFYRAAGRVVGRFMAAQPNQVIVEGDAAGDSVDAVVARLGGAVSPEYVQAALRSLRGTVAIATRWSRLKSAVGLAALALPLAIPIVCLPDHGVYRTVTQAAPRYLLDTNSAGGFHWPMALATLLLTVPGWLAARWLARRWLRRAGGPRLLAWARGHKLLMGWKSGLSGAGAVAVLAGAVYGHWPLWIDGQGKVYGVLPLYAAPLVVAPATAGTSAVSFGRGSLAPTPAEAGAPAVSR